MSDRSAAEIILPSAMSELLLKDVFSSVHYGKCLSKLLPEEREPAYQRWMFSERSSAYQRWAERNDLERCCLTSSLRDNAQIPHGDHQSEWIREDGRLVIVIEPYCKVPLPKAHPRFSYIWEMGNIHAPDDPYSSFHVYVSIDPWMGACRTMKQQRRLFGDDYVPSYDSVDELFIGCCRNDWELRGGRGGYPPTCSCNLACRSLQYPIEREPFGRRGVKSLPADKRPRGRP